MLFLCIFSFLYFLFFAYKGPIIHDDAGWIRVLEETLSGNWLPYRGLWLLQYFHLAGYVLLGKSIQGIYLLKTFLFGIFAVMTYWFFSFFVQKRFLRIFATLYIFFQIDILYSFFTAGSTTDLYIFLEMIAFGMLISFIHKTVEPHLSDQCSFFRCCKKYLPWHLSIILFCFMSALFKEAGIFSFIIAPLSFLGYLFLYQKSDRLHKIKYLLHNSFFFLLAFFGFLFTLKVYKLSNGYVPSGVIQSLDITLLFAFIQRALSMNQKLISFFLAFFLFACGIGIFSLFIRKNKENILHWFTEYHKEHTLFPKLSLIGIWAFIIVLLGPLFPTFDPRYTNPHLFLLAFLTFTLIGVLWDFLAVVLLPLLQKIAKITLFLFLLFFLLLHIFHASDFLFHLKQEYTSFNDVESYIETIDSGALVLYQAGTHDLGNKVLSKPLKNDYMTTGWDQSQIQNLLSTNSNKTIYLVEYPLPWYTTFDQIQEKDLIKRIQYWPIEVKIYIYNASSEKINLVKEKEYPHLGVGFFYYQYDEEQRKIFPLTKTVSFSLGTSTIGIQKKKDTFSIFSVFKLFNGFKIKNKEFVFYEV